MIGAIIGAGASLGGSLIGAGMARAEARENRDWTANQALINRKFQINRENVGWARTVAEQKRQEERALQMSDPAFIRERFEAAGYNPLLATGAMGMTTVPNGPVSQTSGAPGTPGVLTSNAGEIVANGFANFGNAFLEIESLAIQREQLAMENEALRDSAAQMMIAPPAPGIYQRGTTNENLLDTSWGDAVGDRFDSGAIEPHSKKVLTMNGEEINVPTQPLGIDELAAWGFLETVGKTKELVGNVRSGSAWEADKQRLERAAEYFADRAATLPPMWPEAQTPDGVGLPVLPREAPSYRDLKEYLNQ